MSSSMHFFDKSSPCLGWTLDPRGGCRERRGCTAATQVRSVHYIVHYFNTLVYFNLKSLYLFMYVNFMMPDRRLLIKCCHAAHVV